MDKYITIVEAARIAGYSSTSTLKAAAVSGALKTEQPSKNLRLTTPRWLQDYLAKHPRQEEGKGRGARGKKRRPRGTRTPPEGEPTP